MTDITRRLALSTALLAGGAATVRGQDEPETETPTPKTDRDCVIAAGLTEAEADCWAKLAEAAGAFLKLPELHPMDGHEVASAIHVVQNKLLARPTYRKYVELAKQAHANRNQED